MTGRGIVAISVSDGPDLQTFGFLPQHLRRLLAAVAGSTLRAGWRVGYGGDLRTDGFTRSLLADMAAGYARGMFEQRPEAPIVHFFALPSWRDMGPTAILNHLLDKELKPGEAPIAPIIETRFFLPKGGEPFIAVVAQDGRLRRAEGATPIEEAQLLEILGHAQRQEMVDPAAALTAMRQAMGAACRLRVQFSGRVDGYAGALPGIFEEAIEQIRSKGIVLPLGAYGGAAREVAIALGLLRAERVRYPSYGRRYEEAYAQLESMAGVHEETAAPVWRELVETAGLAAPHHIVFHLNAVLAKLAGDEPERYQR
ncbi:MAG: hypothetical protein ABI399_04495 [Bauldia sp.]